MTDENRILKPSTNFPPPFSSEPSSLVASRPILSRPSFLVCSYTYKRNDIFLYFINKKYTNSKGRWELYGGDCFGGKRTESVGRIGLIRRLE